MLQCYKLKDILIIKFELLKYFIFRNTGVTTWLHYRNRIIEFPILIKIKLLHTIVTVRPRHNAKESSSLLSLIYPQEKGEQRRDQFSGGGSGDISFP
jgi:hypothetical protein